MAPRPFWKGYLKLSLVNCPVSMTPAITESEKVRFHTLNRRTGNRLVSHYTDAVTGKPVEEEDEARGYERDEGDYVLLEDEELEDVALETTRTIDIADVRAGGFDRLDLVRPAALSQAGRQGGRGGVFGDPRGDGRHRHDGHIPAGHVPAGASGHAAAARQRASFCGRCATATRCATRMRISGTSATASRTPT